MISESEDLMKEIYMSGQYATRVVYQQSGHSNGLCNRGVTAWGFLYSRNSFSSLSNQRGWASAISGTWLQLNGVLNSYLVIYFCHPCHHKLAMSRNDCIYYMFRGVGILSIVRWVSGWMRLSWRSWESSRHKLHSKHWYISSKWSSL